MIVHLHFAVRGPKLCNKVPDSIKAGATFVFLNVSLSKFTRGPQAIMFIIEIKWNDS